MFNLDELNSLAQKTEEFELPIEFTPADRAEMEKDFAQNAIALEKIKNAKKLSISEFDEQMKPLRKVSSEILRKLTDGYEVEKRQCYLVPNYETNMMEFFDTSSGEMLHSRRLYANERQTQLPSTLKLKKVGE